MSRSLNHQNFVSFWLVFLGVFMIRVIWENQYLNRTYVPTRTMRLRASKFRPLPKYESYEDIMKESMQASKVASRSIEAPKSPTTNQAKTAPKTKEKSIRPEQQQWTEKEINDSPEPTPKSASKSIDQTPALTDQSDLVITGESKSDDNGLFLVIADQRSGADFLMSILNEEVCASGDFPTAALQPTIMPWLETGSKEIGCTLAFLHEHLSSLEPSRCQNQENDTLQPHLPRLCSIKEKHGNLTLPELAKVFVDNFASGEATVTGCSCSSSPVRGLKVMSEWLEDVPLKSTRFLGSKMIRLKRRNYFERYMSLAMSYQTNIWSVQNAEDKREQFEKFKKLQHAVDVDEMFRHFKQYEEIDAKADAWIQETGSQVLWVDYNDLRTRPEQAFASIFEFLGIQSTAASSWKKPLEGMGTFQAFSGPNILDAVANRPQVVEALGANGAGSFVNLKYRPIQHIVYDREKAHDSQFSVGFNETVLNGSSKFQSILETLQGMDKDDIVVVSDAKRQTSSMHTNHHIRNLSQLFEQIGIFRQALLQMNKRYAGAVFAATSKECCGGTLSQREPGHFFGSDGTRKEASRCLGKECALPIQGDDDKSQMWRNHFETLSKRRGMEQAQEIFLDEGLMAGTVQNLITLIKTSDIGPTEDAQAVLSDYAYNTPKLLVLDYEHKLFGTRFEGVTDKIEANCELSDTFSRFESNASPLFLQSPRNTQCIASNHESLPSWDRTGIAFQPIVDHVDRLVIQNVTVGGIDRHFGREILYLVEKDGIQGSQVKRDQYRVLPTEKFLRFSHELLKQNPERWDRLSAALQSGGFPFFAWYGDWKHCAEDVPVFTTCSMTGCPRSFPSPAYMTIINSQPSPSHWYRFFRSYDETYPWESKIRKIVWRGGLSENDPAKVKDSARWRISKLTHELNSDSFDVGLTNIPSFLTAQIDLDANEVGGLKPGIPDMSDFQKYTGILDLDGNSWSSRFSTLLCYNSVVFKVEPKYVDHFFHDLIPWKHYVPVKDDLSDLVENTDFILNNDHIAQEIVHSANHWCAEKLTTTSLAHDQLNIWTKYLELLDEKDPDWTTAWTAKRQSMDDRYNMSSI